MRDVWLMVTTARSCASRHTRSFRKSCMLHDASKRHAWCHRNPYGCVFLTPHPPKTLYPQPSTLNGCAVSRTRPSPHTPAPTHAPCATDGCPVQGSTSWVEGSGWVLHPHTTRNTRPSTLNGAAVSRPRCLAAAPSPTAP
jgi:hypothetical protein